MDTILASMTKIKNNEIVSNKSKYLSFDNLYLQISANEKMYTAK